MTSRCKINAESSPFECDRNLRFALLGLGLAIQLLVVGCVSNRTEISLNRSNSNDFGDFAVRRTTQAAPAHWTSVRRITSTAAVKSEIQESKIRFGQNVVKSNASLVAAIPLYDPVPESAVLAGPAYQLTRCPPPAPLNFCDDLRSLPTRFFDEIDSLATCENAIFLGTAAGVTLYLHDNVDNRVASNIAEHGPQWGNVSDVISDFGHSFPVQLPLLAGMYATSLWHQDDDLHDLTLTMFTTYKFTLLSSVALQYATRTHISGNGIFDFLADSGFPSQQTATSFALAAVVDEAFGWQGGLPAYLCAGLIGWSEVDQNQHHVSDVVFGAALGYVIGKSIGSLHYRPDAPFKLVPLIDTYSGTQGMGIEFLY